MSLFIQGQITEVGYQPPESMTFEEWQSAGEVLGRIERASRFWIGDWLNFGERKYGEKYAQGMDATGLEYSSLQNCSYVSNRIEMSRRRDNLSWSHHECVAACDTQEEADGWLDLAEKNKWSRSDLRAAMREQRALPQDSSLDGCTVEDLDLLIQAGTKFGCIYADPPWLYENQATRAATSNHYGGMTVQEISDLPIKDLVADQAHCHLWITAGFLFEGKSILEAWGFEYKSFFVWCKPQMGLGNYWRVSSEIMLLGVRGGKVFNDHSLKNYVSADRTRHSAKPDEVRSMIEKASPGPYLELFGRKAVTGWAVWGNEVSRDLLTIDMEAV